jgi:hypothetical protein
MHFAVDNGWRRDDPMARVKSFTAFDRSSLRWLWDQHLTAEPEGPSFISDTVA